MRQIGDLFQNNKEQIIRKYGEYYYKNFNDHLCIKIQRTESGPGLRTVSSLIQAIKDILKFLSQLS